MKRIKITSKMQPRIRHTGATERLVDPEIVVAALGLNPSTRSLQIIKPIRTPTDHEQALARVAEIFSAKPDTPEFDELDALTTLIDAYERVNHPIR